MLNVLQQDARKFVACEKLVLLVNSMVYFAILFLLHLYGKSHALISRNLLKD